MMNSEANANTSNTQAGFRILTVDPWLAPYQQDIELRMKCYREVKESLLGDTESFAEFANGHEYFGFHRTENGWVYREWAPAADALSLVGDFNNWDRTSHPLSRLKDGVWELFIPGKDTITHQSRVKVHVRSRGSERDRIPLFIRKVVQDPNTNDFSGQIWEPEHPFEWTDEHYHINHALSPFIYETHIGMAQETYDIGTYKEFEENILPRVKALGYNTIQIMAIMEHPYYASFGYHVSNYFAACSWFGTPDELKSLVNKAHEMGIAILMDIVQSHAVKNLA